MNVRCILIVEADITVRHPLSEYLRECGYQVIEATSTDEAVQFLNNGEPAIEVVLADVDAKGQVDGFGLAQWMRQKGSTAEIILAGTASKAAEKAGDICLEGPVSTRPFQHQVLLDRIKAMVATRERRGRS
jgi:DNA-binding response OmpR family regulator